MERMSRPEVEYDAMHASEPTVSSVLLAQLNGLMQEEPSEALKAMLGRHYKEEVNGAARRKPKGQGTKLSPLARHFTATRQDRY